MRQALSGLAGWDYFKYNRMIKTLHFLIALLFILPLSAQKKKSKDAGPSNFHIEELAEGVWAAIHNDQYGKAICNAAIIDLGDKTLVFDPFMTPQAAIELRKKAEELTRRPVTIVVNSHFHNDHIRGNQVFKPFATFISSEDTRNQIAIVEPRQQEWEKHNAPILLKATRKLMATSYGTEKDELPMWIGYYEGMMESSDDLETILPDIVFRDSLWIHGSKRDVKLVEYRNCHTISDVALFLPSDRIAFLGDLLFVKRHPWLGDGVPENWQNVLSELSNDEQIEKYVPGHGPVCDKKGLKDLSTYLTLVSDLVEKAVTDSSTQQLIIQDIPRQYQEWYFRKFYASNIKHLLSNYTRHER